MLLVAQGCEPKCTEVGVVTTDQLIHSVGEDRFANIKLLKIENFLWRTDLMGGDLWAKRPMKEPEELSLHFGQ